MSAGLFDATIDNLYDMDALTLYDIGLDGGTPSVGTGLFDLALDDLFDATADELYDILMESSGTSCAGECLFDATADGLFDMAIDTLFDIPLDCPSLPIVGKCLFDAVKIAAILTTVEALADSLSVMQAAFLQLQTDVTAIKNKFPTTGTIPTVDNITAARDAILTQGNSAWKTAVGFATPADVKLTTNTQTVNVTQETVNVTTQMVDLSALENTLSAVKSKVDTLPANPVEVVTQQVNVTQETVNVTTQTVDLTAVTNTLLAIKTRTDKIPDAPAAAGNIPTAADIASAVGRRQVTANPPLLSHDGLVLAALSSVTEPSIGNPATGTLRVKNPDGSTLGTFTLGVEDAATAKVIIGVTP